LGARLAAAAATKRGTAAANVVAAWISATASVSRLRLGRTRATEAVVRRPEAAAERLSATARTVKRRTVETLLLWVFGLIIAIVASVFLIVLLGAGMHVR
jgi:hypothetical protein